MKNLKIAILTRAGFAYHLNVGWGFFEKIENCNEDLDWRPILFFCKEADERVMQAQMEEIEHVGYNLIIAVGSLRTRIAYNYIKERNLDIPLIFCGVTDPVGLGILSTLEPQRNLTGVVRESVEISLIAQMLYQIKPGLKKVLIPYHGPAEDGLVEKRLREAQRYLQSKGVQVKLLPVVGEREFPSIINDVIEEYDTLWCTEGSFLENFNRTLVELCDRFGITLFTNEIGGAKEGAALAFGGNVRRVGYALFEQVYALAQKHKAPHEIPIITVSNDRQIIVNTDACKRQGLEIDPVTLFCIKNSSIVS